MCGRFAIILPPDAVRAYFRYTEQPNFPPRYNIAPTQPVPVVRTSRNERGESERHFVLVRWGFLPSFVKDPKDFPLVINARSETVLEKPSFRNAMRRRRCIFIADAFYEWLRDKSARGRTPAIPYLIRRRDGAPMAFAGLWENWSGPNGEEVETACILTTHANATMAAVHDRMPVILEPENFDLWLDNEEADVNDAAALMRPAEEDVLELFEISTAVNAVRNDGPEIQAPVKISVSRKSASPNSASASASALAPARKPSADTGKRAGKQGDLFG